MQQRQQQKKRKKPRFAAAGLDESSATHSNYTHDYIARCFSVAASPMSTYTQSHGVPPLIASPNEFVRMGAGVKAEVEKKRYVREPA